MVTLPPGRVAVRIVDITSGTLISQETVIPGPVESLPPTATVTATPTANVTPTATATPTPTATTPSRTYGVTVSWSLPGLGSITPLPSTAISSGQTVSVPAGSSPGFTFSPNANKAVLTIKLDGATVYTGSAKGLPVSVTIPSIASAHTLAATFG